MSPDDIERDDLVARALGSLSVPEHRPGFWERVDGAFDAIDHEGRVGATPAAAQEASGRAEVHDLDDARRSPRRRARFGRRYQMLSAAAAVALVIAGVGVLNNSSGSGKTDGPIAATLVTDAEVKAAQAAAVQEWQEASAAGDADRVWRLLGPLSQETYGGRDKFGERFNRPGSKRTLGADAYAPVNEWDSFAIPGEPPGAVVVAPPADVGSDTKLRVPIVEVDGRWLIEDFGIGRNPTGSELLSRSARKEGEPIDIPIEIFSEPEVEIYGRIDGQGRFTKLVHQSGGTFQYDRKLSDLPPGDHYLETVQRSDRHFFVVDIGLTGDATTVKNPDNSQLAIAAVKAWSQAVAEGDAGRAWELMGPASQEYLTAQGGWDDMVREMAEGSHAAWSRKPDAIWTYHGLEPFGDGVVLVQGDLELEGMKEYRNAAYPVVHLDEGWKVEPFAFGPGATDAEFITPAPGENGLGGIGPEAAIKVDVIPNSEVWVSIDGGSLEPMVKTGERRWSYGPPAGLANGTHEIVVVTRTHRTVNPPDGVWFTAAAGQFAVEG